MSRLVVEEVDMPLPDGTAINITDSSDVPGAVDQVVRHGSSVILPVQSG